MAKPESPADFGKTAFPSFAVLLGKRDLSKYFFYLVTIYIKNINIFYNKYFINKIFINKIYKINFILRWGDFSQKIEQGGMLCSEGCFSMKNEQRSDQRSRSRKNYFFSTHFSSAVLKGLTNW
jgi:hypothetical protein